MAVDGAVLARLDLLEKIVSLVVHENEGRKIHDITLALEPEDSVIWVYGLDNDGILAFTDDGIEEVQRLLDEYRHDTTSKP